MILCQSIEEEREKEQDHLLVNNSNV